MPAENQRVSLLFQSGIDKLKAGGVDPSPSDVVRLWKVSEAVINGNGDGAAALLEVPVQVGSVTLWPRTIGSALWWETYGKNWFTDPADEVLAIAWMLAIGHDENLMRTTTSKALCVARLVAWQP